MLNRNNKPVIGSGGNTTGQNPAKGATNEDRAEASATENTAIPAWVTAKLEQTLKRVAAQEKAKFEAEWKKILGPDYFPPSKDSSEE